MCILPSCSWSFLTGDGTSLRSERHIPSNSESSITSSIARTSEEQFSELPPVPTPTSQLELSLAYNPGSDGTYAQNYQDLWVAKLAKLNGWVDKANPPFFLDLGAFKGLECSNTAKIYVVRINYVQQWERENS